LRFNKLLKLIKSSLQTLKDALEGLVSMNAELNLLFENIYDNRIPALWMKISYGSLKSLEAYLQDFIKRIAFIRKWVKEGAPPVFWVSGFYFTQSFLTGCKQNYARQNKLPIDALEFDFEVINDDNDLDLTVPPEYGAHIIGLFLEGCRFDQE